MPNAACTPAGSAIGIATAPALPEGAGIALAALGRGDIRGPGAQVGKDALGVEAMGFSVAAICVTRLPSGEVDERRGSMLPSSMLISREVALRARCISIWILCCALL